MLENPPADLAKAPAGAIPTDEQFQMQIVNGPGLRWKTAYGKTAGGLPLDELVPPGGSAVQTIWIAGDITVDRAGPVDLRIAAPEGTAAQIGGTRVDPANAAAVQCAKGGNRLVLRVPVTHSAGQEVKVEVHKTKDSPGRVDGAGGP